MKKLFALLSLLVLPLSMMAQETNEFGVRVPSGYQGNIEYSNLFYLNGGTGMMLSTTHGYFYTQNLYVGLGIGLHVAPDDVYVPVFAAAKYVVNHKKISPVVQYRMGSYFTEGAKPYMDVAFGMRFASDRDFAFSIMAAGSYYSPYTIVNNELVYDPFTDGYNYVTSFEHGNMSCLSIRLGIEW